MKWPQIEADGVDTNLGEITNCTLCDITEGQFPHMYVCKGGTFYEFASYTFTTGLCHLNFSA